MHSRQSFNLGIDIETVEQRMEQHGGLPSHTYCDRDVYDFELEHVFAKTWQLFAPASKLANRGDVVVGQVGKTPIAVACGEDGSLHGFVNICRHRSYTVVEKDKRKCRRLVCQYHAWSYNLDGSLASAPDSDEEPGFNKEKLGLRPVSVARAGPVVFVNIDPDAAPLFEAIPALETMADLFPSSIELDSYDFYKEVETDQAGNWKLWLENSTECYHCPTIHGRTFSDAFQTSAGTYDFYEKGLVTVVRYKAAERADPTALTSTELTAIQGFPGLHIIQQDEILLFGKITPTGPGSCRYTAYYFGRKGESRDRIEEWIDLWIQTFEEDARVIEVQQRNIESGFSEDFHFVDKREFHPMYMLRTAWSFYKHGLEGPQTPPQAGLAAE